MNLNFNFVKDLFFDKPMSFFIFLVMGIIVPNFIGILFLLLYLFFRNNLFLLLGNISIALSLGFSSALIILIFLSFFVKEKELIKKSK